MSEGGSDEDKTEDPTPKKLREAREKGQVVQSREVNTWMMLFTAAMLLSWSVVWMCESLMTLLQQFLARPEQFEMDSGALGETLHQLSVDMLRILLVPLVIFFVTALTSGFVQVGPLLSAESLKPSIDKINPLKGFKRVFGGRAWFEFLKAFGKMTLVGTVATITLIPIYNDAPGMVGIELGDMMDLLRHESQSLLKSVLTILFVFAVIDYAVQRRNYMQQMRMSKQEIKDEYKQSEGDPHIKAKLRELRMQRARKRMMAKVPTADVIITNPTHFAVAMEYNTKKGGAPIVVAKGADRIALKIREIAKDNQVPIIENPPLARALYDTVELDEQIPEQHYKAVAEIISYVYSLKKR